MLEFPVTDILENGAMLVFHDLLDSVLEVRTAQKRGIESFARGEEFAGFVDERFDTAGARSDILRLDVEDRAHIFDLGVKAGHLPHIILARRKISTSQIPASLAPGLAFKHAVPQEVKGLLDNLVAFQERTMAVGKDDKIVHAR